MPHYLTKAVGILHLPFVEPEDLFVQVGIKVAGENADVRSLDAPLEEGPEVLGSIRVDLAAYELDGVVIYRLVPVAGLEAAVADERVGEDLRAGSTFFAISP